jgi:hypothetical protein
MLFERKVPSKGKAMKERVCFYKAEIDTLLDSEEKKAR